MRPRNEPNMRALDPRLVDLQRRAGRFADRWVAKNYIIDTSGGEFIGEVRDAEMAQYICDLHTHFLPVLNQLLYRLRSGADLEKE